MKKLKLKNKYFLIAILAFSVFFRVWNTASFDVGGDHALNSFRALGWLDYIPGEGQVGPMQWFGERPGWSVLSFQDAPPLVFALQRASFILFGDNTFASRAPFFFAGILCVWLIYLLLKKYADSATALLGAIIMGISSYAVWASVAGYLEGVSVLFILLSLYYMFPWLEGRPKQKYFWPVFSSLSFLSKYTSLFLFPAGVASAILVAKRKFLGKKMITHILVSIGISLLLMSPLIIYSLKVFLTRGHFDSSLSSFVGISSPDFYILGNRHATFNILGNLTGMIRILRETNSLPYILFFAAALVFMAIKAFRKKTSLFENILLIHFVFLALMFSFSGSNAVRMLSIFSVFMAMITAIFITGLYRFIQEKNKMLALVFLTVSVAMIIAETAYSFNTNILQRPIGGPQNMFAPSRLYDRGWNGVERYIRKNIFTERNSRESIRAVSDMTSLSAEDISGKNILFYDERLNWFSLSWYLNKYLIYYKSPVFKVSDLSKSVNNLDFISYLTSLGGKNIYFLYGVHDSVLDKIKKNGSVAESTEAFRKTLDENKVPFEEIRASDGNVTFRFYKLK